MGIFQENTNGPDAGGFPDLPFSVEYCAIARLSPSINRFMKAARDKFRRRYGSWRHDAGGAGSGFWGSVFVGGVKGLGAL